MEKNIKLEKYIKYLGITYINLDDKLPCAYEESSNLEILASFNIYLLFL